MSQVFIFSAPLELNPLTLIPFHELFPLLWLRIPPWFLRVCVFPTSYAFFRFLCLRLHVDAYFPVFACDFRLPPHLFAFLAVSCFFSTKLLDNIFFLVISFFYSLWLYFDVPDHPFTMILLIWGFSHLFFFGSLFVMSPPFFPFLLLPAQYPSHFPPFLYRLYRLFLEFPFSYLFPTADFLYLTVIQSCHITKPPICCTMLLSDLGASPLLSFSVFFFHFLALSIFPTLLFSFPFVSCVPVRLRGLDFIAFVSSTFCFPKRLFFLPLLSLLLPLLFRLCVPARSCFPFVGLFSQSLPPLCLALSVLFHACQFLFQNYCVYGFFL